MTKIPMRYLSNAAWVNSRRCYTQRELTHASFEIAKLGSISIMWCWVVKLLYLVPLTVVLFFFLYFMGMYSSWTIWCVIDMGSTVNMEPKFGQHSKSKYCLELHTVMILLVWFTTTSLQSWFPRTVKPLMNKPPLNFWKIPYITLKRCDPQLYIHFCNLKTSVS